MKKSYLNLILLLSVSLTYFGCRGSSSVGVEYTVESHYNCYEVYDEYGYYLYDDCYWEYYNLNGDIASSELDMSGEVADTQKHVLEKMASKYSEDFSLSLDEGMKVAKNIQDLKALEDRSESDFADFAQKLYGVDPTDIVSAVSSAQTGNNSELEALIDSIEFSTSNENKKALIKELHGQALKESGINI